MVGVSQLSDVTINHKATNTTWYLHSQALYGDEDPQHNPALITALENSNLTEADLHHFMPLFYGGLLNINYLELACHWESIFEKAGIQNATCLKLISDVSKDSRCFDNCFDLLLRSWFAPFVPSESRLPFELSHDSSVYPHLFERVSAHLYEHSFKSRLDHFFASLEQKEGFFASVTSFFSRSSSYREGKGRSSLDAPENLYGRIVKTFPLFTDSKKDVDNHLLLPFNYAIRIAGDHRYLMVCGWKLYSKWNWFKALVDSGMEESKSRIVTLPSSWSLGALYAVVIAIEMNNFYPHLDQASMGCLLHLKHDYGLVDSMTNEPIAILKPIFDQAYRYCYDLTRQDPFFVLQMAYDNKDIAPFQKTLKHIHRVFYDVSFSSLAKLSPEVIVLFSSPDALKQWKASLAPESRQYIWEDPRNSSSK